MKGQDRVVEVLQSKLKSKTLPNVVLFAGPTGSGKTTVARICAKELGVSHAFSLIEINCADVRGIDSVREIADALKSRPLSGIRVYILDEIVQLPKATQQAFLKVLEDTPAHTYFFLCASDTSGLLPTFVGRCFVLNLQPLSATVLTDILVRALIGEKRSVPNPVMLAVVTQCRGSARSALNLLEACLTAETEEEQLEIIGAATLEQEELPAFLGKMLLYQNVSWDKLKPIFEKVEDNGLESLRRGILGYASKALIDGWKGVKRKDAFLLIRMFEEPFFMSGKAGLVAACWQYLSDKER